MIRNILLTAACLIVATTAQAQEPQDTRTKIIDPNVRTLKVAPLSNAYMPPVIVMGSVDKINVDFDYMDFDEHYLRYSVKHCNANWQPSELVESEYVDGFNYGDITDYDHSQATFVQYCHYNFALPNEDFKLTKSGNYLLTVYEQDDPDNVLFQTRFSVCEHLVDVMATATSNTDMDYNNEHQQVAVEVSYKMGAISDPYNDLKLVVSQNTRTDNERIITKPMMVEMGKVTYDHNQQLVFTAGNEYRRIETVNTKGYNLGNVKIQYFEPYYHAQLPVDLPRNNKQYLYDQTQFGHFTVRNSESDNGATEADYCVTHFVLNTGRPLTGGTLFLDGEFTQGLPANVTAMRYDAATGCYVNDLLLKQGAYNYQYLWVPDGTYTGLTSPIEGDKYQTVNRYSVKVYSRAMGERYDRLVGYDTAYSGR
ncbi:MAG: DUF5103 domain-containing protein [Muribaculaceae bacterium]|nr:DUF5103 domain-containing protein [Muribaculaceae bacterium]